MDSYHNPVMLAEMLDHLQPKPGGIYVDATLGGGGYSAAIAPKIVPNGLIFGIDRDEEALLAASERLSDRRDSFRPLHGNFADLGFLLPRAGIEAMDGIVFDLGVSSHQFDAGERGFSFRWDAPLDMRMDRSRGKTARELILESSERELTRILREYGEEKWAARIAQFLVRQREAIETTGDLARVVEAAVPKAARPKEIHAATKTFQAFRIAVNGELDALSDALDEGIRLLKPDGRLVVVSYHSLEDRIVKRRLQAWENPCICPPHMPVCGCGRRPLARALTHGIVVPSEEEIAANPRARSAKLRAAVKLRPPDESKG
jgi:16S rRNA (cytosine1402-N4)-methyltransferase